MADPRNVVEKFLAGLTPHLRTLDGATESAIREVLRMADEAPPSPAVWLAANDVDLAPLTGTDHRAMRAIAECWELYSYTRSPHALAAVRSCLATMQPKCRVLTKKLIARAMDWSDVEQLWPFVSGDDDDA